MKAVKGLRFEKYGFSIRIGDFYPEIYKKLELIGYEATEDVTSETGEYVGISDSETLTGRFGFDLNSDDTIKQIWIY